MVYCTLTQTLHQPNSPKVNTQRENIYFRPLASNQTAIDSFVLSRYATKSVVIMLQITVASSHEIKTSGIDALRAILPAEARAGAPHLVFVVPAGTRMRSAQTFIPSAGNPPWAGSVKQSVLELSEDQLFTD